MKKYSVLVVDDEAQNIELAELILKKEGYDLFFAKDYTSTFKLLYLETIDVLVLDLMLLDIDGFSILKELKVDERYKDIEVIVVSALNDEQSKSRAMSLGACAYISKPYDIISLKSKVKETLKKSKKNRLNIKEFLDKSFKDIYKNLGEEKKKKYIIEFLKEDGCGLELSLQMSYLSWFSEAKGKDFYLNEKSLRPLSFILVGEASLDILQSCMNKILIKPYLKGLNLEEDALFQSAPLYF